MIYIISPAPRYVFICGASITVLECRAATSALSLEEVHPESRNRSASQPASKDQCRSPWHHLQCQVCLWCPTILLPCRTSPALSSWPQVLLDVCNKAVTATFSTGSLELAASSINRRCLTFAKNCGKLALASDDEECLKDLIVHSRRLQPSSTAPTIFFGVAVALAITGTVQSRLHVLQRHSWIACPLSGSLQVLLGELDPSALLDLLFKLPIFRRKI
jgi:predicted small metal-binding protein